MAAAQVRPGVKRIWNKRVDMQIVQYAIRFLANTRDNLSKIKFTLMKGRYCTVLKLL